MGHAGAARPFPPLVSLMSRKNNLQRRKVQQSFDQRREEELKAKQEAKRERKAANHEAKQAAAAPPAAVVPQAHALPVASNGVSKPQRKQKQKGFRVKKNGELALKPCLRHLRPLASPL